MKRWTHMLVLIATVLLSPLALAEPLKILYVTGGGYHDYPNQAKIIPQGLEKQLDAKVTVKMLEGGNRAPTRHPAYADENWADGFDVVVHNICHCADSNDQEYIQRIAKAHEGGVPGLFLHCSMHCYRPDETNTWQKLVGVTTKNHERHAPITITNKKADHPIMKGFPKEWKTPQGELYRILKVWDKTTVLATGVASENKEYPVIWISEYGKGRIFGTTIGHHNETVGTEEYLGLISRAVVWASEGKVEVAEKGAAADEIEIPQDDLQLKLDIYFATAPEDRKDADVELAMYANASKEDAAFMQKRVWEAYRFGEKFGALSEDFLAGYIVDGDYKMPFTFEKRGTMPEGGWPVVMAMHGGGGAPAPVNDSQWDHMKTRYKIDNCIYMALRAPTDEWNGFYTGYFYKILYKTVRAVNLFEQTNPDRFYLLGYSHGGYGAFACGPKMPDCFGAVHASAGAQTDGQCLPENLMNLRFTHWLGGRDTAYGRLDRNRKFDGWIAELKKEYPGLYNVEYQEFEGVPHSSVRDHEIVNEMAKHSRNAFPKQLHWKTTDNVIQHHYWVSIGEPAGGKTVQAKRNGNRIELTTENVDTLIVNLNDHIVDYSKPVTIIVNDDVRFEGKVQRSLATLCRSLEERGDPKLMYDSQITISGLNQD